MTVDLTGWLLEQLDHDEAVVKEQGETHTLDCTARIPQEWDHACRCGFANRVPAECEAKRRIIASVKLALRHHPAATPQCPNNERCACRECLTVRYLALPYSDREGYPEEWRSE